MEKVVLLLWILVVSISSAIQVQSTYYSPSKPYKPVQEKITHLHFYTHDTQSGKNPTAVRIAGPSTEENNPGASGTTFAIDDPLTEGPENTSKVIGNARGMYMMSNPLQDKNPTLVLYVDLGFTTGKFQGSSLSLFSRNLYTEAQREVAVVGGRGLFRYAKGFVMVKTNSVSSNNTDAVLEYTVQVVHP